MVDILVKHLAKRHFFWQQTVCRAGKPTICQYVKFLIAMKMICYSVSGNAFMDYFQMGPSRKDARKIIALHQRVHKIPGMMDSLDITKVHWKR
eukprot:CCRYP_004366-RB/>CCRYP_004366-RB protein AED:0.36 eAED:0.36 QI:0/0/0/1/0/0/2/0/92